MYKAILFSTLLAALVLLIAGRASAQVERFQGEWKNTNRHATELVKLDIDVHGDDVEVRAWPGCHEYIRRECSPGSSRSCYDTTTCGDFSSRPLPAVRAEIYAPSDSDNPAGKASGLLVRYPTRLLVIELQGDKLSADIFTDVHVEPDFSVSVITTRFQHDAHVQHDLFKH